MTPRNDVSFGVVRSRFLLVCLTLLAYAPVLRGAVSKDAMAESSIRLSARWAAQAPLIDLLAAEIVMSRQV